MPEKKTVGRKGRKKSADPLVRLNARILSSRLPLYQAAAVCKEQPWSDWVRDALEAHAKKCLPKSLYVPPPKRP